MVDDNEFYDSVNPVNKNEMIVTWDTGKRCNFDCAYCGPERHDNFSKFPPFEELTKGVDFLKEYFRTMLPRRRNPAASISLTGGEPTANPSFMKFAQYLNDEFKDFEYRIVISLTTNGSYPKKNIPEIARLFNSMTLSYHCDSNSKIKEKVRENILLTHQAMKSFKVNLMMHPYDEYWQECLDLIEVMKEHKVKFIPRVINGLSYSDEQSKWLKDYWAGQNNDDTKTKIEVVKPGQGKSLEDRAFHKEDRTIKPDVEKVLKFVKADKTKTNTLTGRHCCNKVDLDCELTNSNQKETIQYLGDTRFQEWYCSINWFFLHLESQTDQIFHHQTCQAQYGKGKGAVGKISEWETFVEEVQGYLKDGMPVIQCPNIKCGCGLCATKAKNFTKFIGLVSGHVDGVTYYYGK